MKRILKGKWARRASGTMLGTMLWLGCGCTAFEESGLPGSASSMARNQIMPVNAETASFGHYRLVSLMRIFPDLDLFVAKNGLPDFIAETSNRDQQYYILYYLRDRQAFAARTRAPDRRRLEFSGPYPITDKEIETLGQIGTQTPSNGLVPRRLNTAGNVPHDFRNP